MDRRDLTRIVAVAAVVVLLAALTIFEVYVSRPVLPEIAAAPAQPAGQSTTLPQAGTTPPAVAGVAANTPPAAGTPPVADTATPPAGAAVAANTPPAATDTTTTPPAGATVAANTPPTAVAQTAPGAAAPADTTAGPNVAMLSPGETPPAATAPVMPGPPGVPTFDVVRVEPSGDTVIAGQAEPEAKVEVLDGTAPIATAEADQNGEWALSLDKPLAPGPHDLALRTTSKDQKTETLSDQRVTVSVPEKGSKDVLVVMNTPDTPSKVLQVPGGAPAAETQQSAENTPAVVVKEPPIQGEAPVAAEPKIALEAPVATEPAITPEAPIAIEPPAAAKAEPPAAADEQKLAEKEPAPPPPPKPEVVVAAVEADTAGSLYIAGTVTTGETVRVYLDGKPLGDAKPSPSGTWLVETKRDLPVGSYTVRADQLDDSGTVIARSEVPFEREVDVAILKPTGSASTDASGATLAGAMAPMETVIIKHGDNLWRIARGAWGKGVRWSTIYQANDDQIRNPHWIYPGQVFIMPKGSVTWTD